MRGIHAAVAGTLLLCFVPLAGGAFTDTHPEQDGLIVGVDAANSSVTSAESERHFGIDNVQDVPVYLKMTGNEGEATFLSEAGYSVDMYLSRDGGATWTQVAQGVQSTDPSATVLMNATDQPAALFVMNFPEQRNSRVVDVGFHIALDESGTGGGNGGVQQPTLTHDVDLYFYSSVSDLDNDGLTDAWEYEHFGNLDATASADPDGDGATNKQEHDAGTDPLSAGSEPGGNNGPGSGGVEPAPHGYWFLAIIAQVVLAVAAAVGLWLAKRRAGRGFTDQKVLLVWGPSALLLLAAFVGVWLLEMLPGTGEGWAAWKYPGLSVDASIWAAAGTLLVVAFGVLAAYRQPQDEQGAAGARAIAAGVAVSATALLLFGLLDLPTPFSL